MFKAEGLGEVSACIHDIKLAIVVCKTAKGALLRLMTVVDRVLTSLSNS